MAKSCKGLVSHAAGFGVVTQSKCCVARVVGRSVVTTLKTAVLESSKGPINNYHAIVKSSFFRSLNCNRRN